MPEIHVADCGAFICSPEDCVLVGMERAGGQWIPVGCRRGGCGVCKVMVVSGPYLTGKMSTRHVSAEERRQGVALACQVFPLGDLELSLMVGNATLNRSQDDY